MKKYGLIGRNISYSFSGKYFAEKWEREGVKDCSYTIYDIEKVEEVKKILEDHEIKGLNVTIPYKLDIMPLLDDISPEAREIGAVNTVKVMEDGSLVGYNSDVYGFRSSLAPYLESHHNRALILGTGGASRAVAYALKSLGIDFFYVSRDKKGEDSFTYDELGEAHIKHCPLIINCTPLGTFPAVDNCPAIPYECLGEENLLFDLVYNPRETLFMKKGREKGAVTVGGYTMLQLQAEKSWEIWQ